MKKDTTPVFARIDTKLKNDAEEILHQLGITPSSAISMLYSQIIIRKEFPLELSTQNTNKHYNKEDTPAEIKKSIFPFDGPPVVRPKRN